MQTTRTERTKESISPERALSAAMESDTNHFILAYFGKNNSLHLNYLYRGDAKTPGQLFGEGFWARGINPDLASHVEFCRDSAYISTSSSKKVAANYPLLSDKTFLYQINPQQNAIDIIKKHEAGEIAIEPNRFDARYRGEHEQAVRLKISELDIKGAWAVEYGKVKQFIPNPSYVAPEGYLKAEKILNVAKNVGRGATAVAATVDGLRLNDQLEKSKKTGDYDRFFEESARVIGGWSGSAILSPVTARMAVMLTRAVQTARTSASLASPLGPVPTAWAAVAGGLVGSVVGYVAGSDVGHEANKALGAMAAKKSTHLDPTQIRRITQTTAMHQFLSQLQPGANQQTSTSALEHFLASLNVEQLDEAQTLNQQKQFLNAVAEVFYTQIPNKTTISDSNYALYKVNSQHALTGPATEKVLQNYLQEVSQERIQDAQRTQALLNCT